MRVTPHEHLAANEALWDEWAAIHAESSFYDLDRIRRGECRLHQYELDEVGDVRGKTFLHLMCQIGTDTVCWARRGARAVGVDFSAKAVEVATQLAADTGVDARFIQADVLRLPDALPPEPFDVVYTSRGVLRWVPDIGRWAEVIAEYLSPAGFLYVAEIHPVAQALSQRGDDTEPRVGRPYFGRGAALEMSVRGTYAEPDAEVRSTTMYQWPHTMGEIITALAEAGLAVDFLREYPWADRPFGFLRQGEDGRTWAWPPDAPGELPLFFTLRASRR